MHRVTALTLLKYKRWIDAGMLNSIAATNTRHYSVEHKKMLQMMHHIHITDLVIRANLTGAEHAYTGLHIGKAPSEAALILSMQACSNWYVDYVAALEPAAWDRMIMYRRMDGKMAQTSILGLIEQVILHGTRHRGAISWLIISSGGCAPENVVSSFLRESLRNIQ